MTIDVPPGAIISDAPGIQMPIAPPGYGNQSLQHPSPASRMTDRQIEAEIEVVTRPYHGRRMAHDLTDACGDIASRLFVLGAATISEAAYFGRLDRVAGITRVGARLVHWGWSVGE